MKSLIRILQLMLVITLLGSTTGSLLGFLGQFHQNFELLSHFRFTFYVLQIISVIGLLFFKGVRKLAVIGVLLAIPVMVTIWPYDNSPRNQDMDYPYKTPYLRMMNLNVLKENHNYENVKQLIQKEKPDIIALQEPNIAWFQALKPVLRTYQYQLEIPQENNFGIALYSKLPFKRLQTKHFADVSEWNIQCPSILAEVVWQGHSFQLLTTHPLPPLSGFEARNQQLHAIAKERAKWGPSVIVMGDLNTSQWSYYFQEFLKDTHLKDTQLGYGVQLSWPSYSPWVKIPIDHVLVSDNWQILNRRLGPNVDSDHLPVIVDLTLKPKTVRNKM